MKSVEGLREFCLDLSTDKPSPGGGAAAAAAGAMGASLLIMVCGLTRKKKAHEKDWPELARIEFELVGLRDGLLELSSKDAEAYDEVVRASRRSREVGDEDSKRALALAIREATDVPRTTGDKSLRVLEIGARLAEIGSRSASSDAGVGIHLAEVGVRGAALNVLINLKDSADPSYVRTVGEELIARSERAIRYMKEALAKLEKP